MSAFPFTTYQRGNHGNAPMEPYYSSPGMSIKQFYFAHILAGMMRNYPAIMTDPAHHVDMAWQLAGEADRKGQ